jgi:Permuted papain-like amidase enzyme, YaeF/YiiX, C92 family
MTVRHLLPTGTAGRWRLVILLLIFATLGYFNREQCLFLLTRAPAFYYYLRYSPQEGDILFQSLPHGDLVDAIEGVSHSRYSHCGVVLLNDEKKWVVIESIGNVHETPLFAWIFRGRNGYFAAYRLDPKYEPHLAAFKAKLLAYSGYPYDFDYDMSRHQGVYCSDLIYLAFDQAAGEKLGNAERLGDLDWKPHQNFIQAEANGKLPLDRLIITPAALARANQLHRVN